MDSDAKLCSKWQSRILRWSLFSICWSTYILYRSFVVGKLKYDRESGTMIIRPRNIFIKRVALVLKAYLFYLDRFWLSYLLTAAYPLFPISRSEDLKAHFLKLMVEAVACQITIWNIYRLYYWLNSLTWNRSFVRLANEVIHVISLVESTLGPLPLEGIVLLIMYVTQLELTALELINYIDREFYIFVPNILLLQIFYNAYVAYLLVVLSCMALLNRFLERYERMDLSDREQRLKILQLFRLYARINNGHKDIIVLWLPVTSVLSSSTVIMLCHWAAIIYIAMLSHDLDTVGKWNKIVQEHLGAGVAPFLRILLIGLCNDRLALLERFLNLQLLIIDLYSSRSNKASESLAREFSNLHSCVDLQLRAQPIRIPIMSVAQECSCDFVLHFVLCILVNALSYVQYGMSLGRNMFDFHQGDYALGSAT